MSHPVSGGSSCATSRSKLQKAWCPSWSGDTAELWCAHRRGASISRRLLCSMQKSMNLLCATFEPVSEEFVPTNMMMMMIMFFGKRWQVPSNLERLQSKTTSMDCKGEHRA